ncbi:hypothetical protein HOLleu_20982 [Holothuria leucospilota]|uniref:Uncharacterized protein n=1 Tax=Holothuria leucospilota TaxID=206669 RepID=A0A9Q1BVT1_HOLLE|nr:hypothetical protein HOLleu_20982 [Holothuria leucospilota]
MNRETGKLSVDKVRDSEIALIKQARKDEFSNKIECLKKGKGVNVRSHLSALYPRLDKDGVVRGTGRLSLNDSIYPIVLPRRHVITKLIVKNYHELGITLQVSTIPLQWCLRDFG